jgi:hypothetical protein
MGTVLGTVAGKVKKRKKRPKRATTEVKKQPERPMSLAEMVEDLSRLRRSFSPPWSFAGVGKIDIDALSAQLPVIPPREDTAPQRPPIEPEASKPEPPRLDYDRKRVWLDGQWYRIKDGEAELFKDLFDAKGGRVRVQELIPHAAQIRHRMREPLKSLIKSEPGPRLEYSQASPRITELPVVTGCYHLSPLVIGHDCRDGLRCGP